ncbi:hypothetical protein KC19_2G062100 [Ceratodon purpureus]|uniref:Uncharacterized protein n=1 Tax=Ceratodon purpureus TaxID=3225 RepID=A0A8T0ISK0_CERPU|nr:hypothetical protein KC19_2G062100 [Ceratodon purpureus]
MAESDVIASAAAPTDEIGEDMETLFLSCEAPTQALENSGPVTTAEGGVVGSMKSAEEERRARGLHLFQLRRECTSEEEYETARTKSTITEVACTPSESVDDAQELLRKNQLHFQDLVDMLVDDIHPHST